MEEKYEWPIKGCQREAGYPQEYHQGPRRSPLLDSATKLLTSVASMPSRARIPVMGEGE